MRREETCSVVRSHPYTQFSSAEAIIDDLCLIATNNNNFKLEFFIYFLPPPTRTHSFTRSTTPLSLFLISLTLVKITMSCFIPPNIPPTPPTLVIIKTNRPGVFE